MQLKLASKFLVCGQLNSKGRKNSNPKIVGGGETRVNEIPWQAAVAVENSFDGQECGFPVIDAAQVHIDELARISMAAA